MAGEFGLVALLDAFDRADESPLAGGWVTTRPAGTPLDLVSNEVGKVSGGGALSSWDTDTIGPDCEAFIQVPTIPAAGQSCSITCRAVDLGLSTVDYYQFTWTEGTGWRLFRVVNNGYTQLGSTVASPALAAGDWIGIEAASAVPSVKVRGLHKTGGVWSEIIAFEDTNASRPQAAGKCGLEVTSTTARLDNFHAGTIQVPSIRNQGAQNQVTTGTLTLTLPGHETDDILVCTVLVWVPNTAGSAAVIPTPSGWTKGAEVSFPGTPDGHIAFFWKRATSNAESNPVFDRGAGWDTGTDGIYAGRAYSIRDCETSGDPWDELDPTAALTAANGSFEAVTVSGARRLVVQFAAKTDDTGWGTTPTGWGAATATTSATGTDSGFQTFRKEAVTADTAADATATIAPAVGAYAFFGVSFKPPEVSVPTPVADDDSGAGTDVSATSAVYALVESGAGTDASLGSAVNAVTETGAGTDAAVLTVAYALTDSGAGTDASLRTVAQNLVDSGAGTDASLTSAQIAASETGAGTDTATLTTTRAVTESGAGTDASQVSVPKSATETGTGTDTALVTVSKVGSETGAGTDASQTTAQLAAAEMGAGTDASASVVQYAPAETGSGTETVLISAVLVATDDGVGTDVSATIQGNARNGADTGVGSESEVLTAALATTEDGTGTETALRIVSVVASDSGAGSETATLHVSTSDEGGGVGTGDATLIASLASTEAATGTDAAQVTVQRTGSEAGTGTDSGIAGALLAGSEAGAGDDQNVLSAVFASTEDASGSEAAGVGLLLGDTGSGSEAAQTGIFISPSDTGVGNESSAVSKVGLFIYAEGTYIATDPFPRTTTPRIHSRSQPSTPSIARGKSGILPTRNPVTGD